jgi:GNAT superfamily N-acetyltransferase
VNPILEKLRPEDVDETKGLIAEVVLEFYHDLDFLPKTKDALLLHYHTTGYLQDLDRHASEYAAGNGIFLVLKQEGRICGCGGVRRLDDVDGELVRLWLRKDSRGLGFGREILQRLLMAAGEIGFQNLYLDTSLRCGDAIRLFRKNGFEECPQYKESIGDVFMRRRMAGYGEE